jgi:fructokinase
MSDLIMGAIEAGGTKMVCAVGSADTGSRETARIPTGDPDTTCRAIIDFFTAAGKRHGPVSALGVASFGPLDLDRRSPTYGAITATPKRGWQGVNLKQIMAEALDVSVGIDTDVNAAALAESKLGAARGRANVAYVTVGTGIGVGILSEDHMVHGLGHPEAGHLFVPRHAAHKDFAGVCPFHGACLEGMASGPAVQAMWGASLDRVDAAHGAWDVEAHYLAHLCANLILTVAPEHIVLGGGVMSQDRLLPLVRRKTLKVLGGYAPLWDQDGAVESRITLPGCLEPAGLLGAYLVAHQLVDDRSRELAA